VAQRRIEHLAERLQWLDQQIAHAEQECLDGEQAAPAQLSSGAAIEPTDIFSRGMSLEALEGQAQRPEAAGRTVLEMWNDVWAHDVGAAAELASAEQARARAAEREAAVRQAAAEKLREAQAAREAAQKQAAAEAEAAEGLRAAQETSAREAEAEQAAIAAKAQEDSEAARLAAEEEAAAARRRALPSFSDMNEARTNWQASDSAKDPERAKAAAQKGNNHLMAGDLTAAKECYDTAVELDSTSATFFNNRAAVSIKMGGGDNLESAVSDCEHAISLNPNYAKAFTRLGLAYSKLERYELAIERGFSRALLLDPSNEATKKHLATTQAAMATKAANAPLAAAEAAAAAAAQRAKTAAEAAEAAEAAAAAAAAAVEAYDSGVAVSDGQSASATSADSNDDSASSTAGATKEERQEQQRLGRADKQMKKGTWIHVEGHGEGVYEEFKANWVGANNHTIRFGSDLKVLQLKELNWNVVGANSEATTVCECLQKAGSAEIGNPTHIVSLDWSLTFSDVVAALRHSLADFDGKPFLWIDALCQPCQQSEVEAPVARFQKVTSAVWLDQIVAAMSNVGRVVKIQSSWDSTQSLTQPWSAFECMATVNAGASLSYAMTPDDQRKIADTVRQAGPQAIVDLTSGYQSLQEIESPPTPVLQKIAALASDSDIGADKMHTKLVRLTCKGYAHAIEPYFQAQWLLESSQLDNLDTTASVSQSCIDVLQLGHHLAQLWDAADDPQHAATIFGQLLGVMPVGWTAGDSVSVSHDMTQAAFDQLKQRGVQAAMDAFEADFNFATEDVCFLSPIITGLLDELRAMAEADAAALQTVVTQRPKPTSSSCISRWIDVHAVRSLHAWGDLLRHFHTPVPPRLTSLLFACAIVEPTACRATPTHNRLTPGWSECLQGALLCVCASSCRPPPWPARSCKYSTT
jgi:hypothetical protein